jgi:hypothetical protein
MPVGGRRSGDGLSTKIIWPGQNQNAPTDFQSVVRVILQYVEMTES